jgi:hypothetical protein
VLGAGALGAAAPSQQTAYPERGGNLDYFTTNPKGTNLDLRGELALPPDFFDRGSARFEGRIALKGVPIGTYQGRKTKADTIIARTSMPKLGPQYPSRGTTEIEVVALSLASVEPIKVGAGKRTELWDVKLQLSSSRRSQGKMTIVQKDERGGTFDSAFTVYPHLTFVRRGDKAERKLDVGSMKLGEQGTKSITLQASSVPWSTKPPRNAAVQTGTFFAGVVNAQLVPIRHLVLHEVQLLLEVPDPLEPGR